MRHAIDQMKLKGSVLVINKGKPWLDYATDNMADTSYLINSVQKSMTATMVMREVQKGKLKLDDSLSKFYPDIPGADSIKIKNLLNMTSGIDLKAGEKLGTPVYTSDADNIKSDIAKTEFNMDMLGKWHYTSLNYVYLCGILSQLEHKSYEELFRQTFIKPLKLQHTEFLWSAKSKLYASHWVPGYEKEDGVYERVNHAMAVADARDELGAGSVVMSNSDLATTLNAILVGNLLTNHSREILFTGQKPSYYNGGFYNKPRYKVANGAGEGYYTFVRSTNNAKNMLIIQGNHTKAGQFAKIKKQVSNIMDFMLEINR